MFPAKLAVCLLAFVHLVVLECKAEGYEQAPICKRYDCPSYTVVHSQKEFEIRSYKDAKWVSSPVISSNSYREGSNKNFLTLFDYYKGYNVNHVKIHMTAPVLVDVNNSTYTDFFYLPTKYQNNVPQPLSKEITTVTLPKHKYAAVRRYSGFISENNIKEELALLKKSLEGTPYKRAAALQVFTVAGYDSPFTLVNRVNEIFIWFD